jgi:hypothetical protein
VRDAREVVREEPLMRRRILDVLRAEPKTVPEIAAAVGCPEREVMFWVMGMRKYGYLIEMKDVTDEGYFRYRPVDGEGAR